MRVWCARAYARIMLGGVRRACPPRDAALWRCSETPGANRRRMLSPYLSWLSPGDNAWQMTAATLVGLMSIPGLVVLYGGVMQKRWSVNSMMLTFVGFCLVLIAWVLWVFKMGFGHPIAHSGGGVFGTHGFLGTFLGEPGSVLGHAAEEGQEEIPSITTGPPFHFPTSTLVYFQFVFAAITPLLMLGSVLGRFNFKAWIPFVLLWITDRK